MLRVVCILGPMPASLLVAAGRVDVVGLAGESIEPLVALHTIYACITGAVTLHLILRSTGILPHIVVLLRGFNIVENRLVVFIHGNGPRGDKAPHSIAQGDPVIGRSCLVHIAGRGVSGGRPQRTAIDVDADAAGGTDGRTVLGCRPHIAAVDGNDAGIHALGIAPFARRHRHIHSAAVNDQLTAIRPDTIVEVARVGKLSDGISSGFDGAAVDDNVARIITDTNPDTAGFRRHSGVLFQTGQRQAALIGRLLDGEGIYGRIVLRAAVVLTIDAFAHNLDGVFTLQNDFQIAIEVQSGVSVVVIPILSVNLDMKILQVKRRTCRVEIGGAAILAQCAGRRSRATVALIDKIGRIRIQLILYEIPGTTRVEPRVNN